MAPIETEGPVPEVQEVPFEVDGASVVARALGRAGGVGSTPLMLVGFWPEAGDATEHAREALVVARDLADLGEDALRVAWHGGREPPAPPGAPPRRAEPRRRR